MLRCTVVVYLLLISSGGHLARRWYTHLLLWRHSDAYFSGPDPPWSGDINSKNKFLT